MRSLRILVPATIVITGAVSFAACSKSASDADTPAANTPPVKRTQASVTPTAVASNSTCAGLGYAAGCKIDPAGNGSCLIDGTTVTVSNYDSSSFDWSTNGTGSIDAVIVHGGILTILYEYPGGATSDTELGVPGPGCGPPPVTAIEFCIGGDAGAGDAGADVDAGGEGDAGADADAGGEGDADAGGEGDAGADADAGGKVCPDAGGQTW